MGNLLLWEQSGKSEITKPEIDQQQEFLNYFRRSETGEGRGSCRARFVGCPALRRTVPRNDPEHLHYAVSLEIDCRADCRIRPTAGCDSWQRLPLRNPP